MTGPAVLENEHWLRDALEAVAREARTGRKFDAYELQQRQRLADPPSTQQWGTVFRVAGRRRIIREAGFHITSRPTRRGGITRIWEGVPTQKNGAEGSPTKSSLDTAT